MDRARPGGDAGSRRRLLAVDGPAGAVYGLAIVATIAQTLYRPAHSALLPALCMSPQQLTSANVVRGMLDSVATLGGPLVAALLLATSGVASVFAVCAAASLVAGLVVLALPYDPPPRAPRPLEPTAARCCRGSRRSAPIAASCSSPASALRRRSRAAA